MQAEIPNHRKLRRSRAGVVSVAANVPPTAGQVGDEKTNMCEPLLTHRNIYMVAPKLGREGCPRTKARPGGGSSARERPACGLGGARCIGGVSSLQALAWNRRTCRPDTDPVVHMGLFSHPAGEREDPKRQKPQGAEYRCGAQGRAGS